MTPEVGRLVAALQHYRHVLGGLARAQRTGQAVPTAAVGLHTIRQARACLWEALAPFDRADGIRSPRTPA